MLYNWSNEIRMPGAASTAPARVIGGDSVTDPQSIPAQTLPQEIWRSIPLPGCPYEASSEGRIRHIGAPALAPVLSPHGYFNVSIRTSGKFVTMRVHRLIALAFLGPRPEGMVINHLDGDKRNNRAVNLEYTSPQANALHATRTLGKNRGELHGRAKLNPETVNEVRRLYGSGAMAISEIAKCLAISPAHVRQIVHRRNWRHLPPLDVPEASPRRLRGRNGFCAKGHPVNAQNTYFRKSTGAVVYCKVCARGKAKRRREGAVRELRRRGLGE